MLKKRDNVKLLGRFKNRTR